MNDDNSDENIFIYMGRRGVDVPSDVIHVSIHHSVRSIHSYAFSGRSQLRTVTGGDTLEEIRRGSFARCDSLREITITPTVRLIEDKAFYRCSRLTTVNGGLSEELSHIVLRCKRLRFLLMLGLSRKKHSITAQN
jgi:hypothetical protein